VGRLLLIYLIVAASYLVLWSGLWSLAFILYNRHKGKAALRWVQAACAGKGRVISSSWLGSYRLRSRLQFPSRGFEDARVTVQFRRPFFAHWIVDCWHRQKETLTFEADLGGSPSFHLEVVRHRWSARSRSVGRARDQREWEVHHPGPLILTTRTHWKEDPTSELNALMMVQRQDVLQVRFRPESPQFSVTVTLDALSDPATAASFLSTLRELAAGASAHRQ
jgi:hypothetical protein